MNFEYNISEGKITFTVRDSIEAESFEKSDKQVCFMLQGFFAEISENIFKLKKTRCKEIKCKAKGDKKCVFIPVISEPPAMIDNFMAGFTFYDPSLYQQNKMHKFTIAENLLERPNEILEFIEEKIKEIRPDRIVVDPVNPIVYPLEEKECKKFWFKFTGITKGWDTLTLLTGEFLPEEVQKQTISYLTDGVIVLGETITENQTLNYLEVKKMRGANIIKGKRALKFSSDGITIFPRATAMRKPFTGEI